MTRLLLRNHQLGLNLASEEPIVRSHHIFELPEDMESSPYEIFGPFLFTLSEWSSLVCFDLGNSIFGAGAGPGLKELWRYNFPTFDENRRICGYHTQDTDEVGRSVMSLVLGELEHLSVLPSFPLHII